MSQTERIQQIVHLLEHSRHPVPIQRFLDELEVSRATFKRDIEYLRDRLGAPISWRRGGPEEPRGYVLERPAAPGHAAFGISGLWFNQSEIHALLTMHRLVQSMEPGLLADHAGGLLTRIRHLLGSAQDDPVSMLSRIRILHSATRRQPTPWFETIARATVRQRRLRILYFTRSRGETGEREVSPQRLLHYRENWYLLAWCHKTDELRRFSLDAIREVDQRPHASRRIVDKRLDKAIEDGFGIFGGQARETARLRFSPVAARWIADETWHRDQRIVWDRDHLVLQVPYAQPRELVMEILRHGADVEVLGPRELRRAVRETLERARSNYD